MYYYQQQWQQQGKGVLIAVANHDGTKYKKKEMM